MIPPHVLREISDWTRTATPLTGTFFRNVHYTRCKNLLEVNPNIGSNRFAAKGTAALFFSATDVGATKEATDNRSRLGITPSNASDKYPRVSFAVEITLSRTLNFADVMTSPTLQSLYRDCLNSNEHDTSQQLGAQLIALGIQALRYPSVVDPSEENMVVYLKNIPNRSLLNALRIINQQEFLDHTRKMHYPQ